MDHYKPASNVPIFHVHKCVFLFLEGLLQAAAVYILFIQDNE